MIYNMPRKRVIRRRPQRGGDFLGIGNFFKNKVGPALGKAVNFIKDQKLISRGLSMIPDARAKGAAGVASAIGLGRRRRTTTRRRKVGGARVAMQF